jgi:hydroxycarboxylate dehydrogenase B
MANSNTRGDVTISAKKLIAAVQRVFEVAGCSSDEALLIGSHLVDANLVGHDSHGLVRVSRYINLLREGKVLPGRRVETVLDRGPLALLDGQFGFGQSIATQAMEIAANKVPLNGFAAVALRNSGHLGRIGAWAEWLANRKLISLHFVNSSGFSILVAPYGGSDRRLSSNPIAAGVPRIGKPPLILDMATSIIAEGKIQLAKNRGEKLRWGEILDGRGRPTVDPTTFYDDPPGAILPFGAHKGSGLSILCEILAGSLSGGWAGHPKSPTADRLVNNMFSIVLDPGSLVGEAFFADDVARLADWISASPPLDPTRPVMLPGEVEANTRLEREANGIPIDGTTWTEFVRVAASVGLVFDSGAF